MSGRAACLDADAIRARVPLEPLVRQRVKLRRQGRDWEGCCPFHAEQTPSFRVYADNHFHCFGCAAHGDVIDYVMRTHACGFREALQTLSANAGLEPVRSSVPLAVSATADRQDIDAERQRKIACASKLYREAEPGGEMVQAYLASRRCAASIPNILRFHPSCPRRNGTVVERLPAMLAPITDPITNQQVGTHCTFLRSDGRGKIAHGKAKIMWGSWGVIRLVPDEDVTLGLGLAEGIETALAIMQRARWGAVWAAGCAGAMGKFPVLDGIECLTLFPDMDDKGRGSIETQACADRWAAAGRGVQITFPPDGHDWDDALVPQGAA